MRDQPALTLAVDELIDGIVTIMVVAILVMSVVSFVIVGVSPRRLGRHYAISVSLAAAPAVVWMRRIVGPLARLLVIVGNAVTPGRGYRDGPFETEAELSVHQMLAELSDLSALGLEHWVLVEGFKHADLPKIEVWRAAHGARPLYPDDPFVVALAVPAADALPHACGLPRFDLDEAEAGALADFLRSDPSRYEYHAPVPDFGSR